MNRRKKIAIGVLLFLLFDVCFLLVLAYSTTYHPGELEKEEVFCAQNTPKLKPGQELKILNWNVQYMASKNYFFFYDRLDNSGPHLRPSSEDIAKTIKEVARVIKDEKPDIILLQEVDDGAARTDHQDQLEELLKHLPKEYACHTSTIYWKAAYVPHSKINGSVGMKLSTISRYQISSSQRIALPMYKQDPLTDMFYLKRAILKTPFSVEGKQKPYVVYNTHLSAFAQGDDTMERQVKKVRSILDDTTPNSFSWIIAGDFNLLATKKSFDRLARENQSYYNPKTELNMLSGFRIIPSVANIDSPDYAKWFTHFPNDPLIKQPDRTIDYIVLPKTANVLEERVRIHDTLHISDHLPVLTKIKLPD